MKLYLIPAAGRRFTHESIQTLLQEELREYLALCYFVCPLKTTLAAKADSY